MFLLTGNETEMTKRKRRWVGWKDHTTICVSKTNRDKLADLIPDDGSFDDAVSRLLRLTEASGVPDFTRRLEKG